MQENYSYGLLSYSSVNIGDEIQSVAQSRFLPRIDEYVQRETISRFIPTKGLKTKLIMNAWWMFHPANFPPKEEYIDPLLISMYFRDSIREDLIKRKNVRNYLLKHGPVGCRDMGTHKWLQKENIPSYFSGCLSLTLQRNPKIKRQDYILCVNVPNEIVEEIKKKTNRPIYTLSRGLHPIYPPKQRHELAKLVLRLYHDAHLVISPRLHVILPSLAMETPVLRLFSKSPDIVEDVTRYSGYETFFNSIDIDSENWKKEIQKYDFENPPKNPENHLPLRNELIKRCSEFTGFDNKNSVIENDPFPFAKLIQLNAWSKFSLSRIIYYTKEKEILEILLNKIKGITKYDVSERLPKYQKVKYTIKDRIKHFRYSLLANFTKGKTRKKYLKKYKKLQKQKICYELQKYLNKV